MGFAPCGLIIYYYIRMGKRGVGGRLGYRPAAPSCCARGTCSGRVSFFRWGSLIPLKVQFQGEGVDGSSKQPTPEMARAESPLFHKAPLFPFVEKIRIKPYCVRWAASPCFV